MANIKISQLASAAALTGTEEVPVVQSNATVKTTVQDIANLAGGFQPLEILADGTVTPASLSLISYVTYLPVIGVSGNQTVVPVTIPSITLDGGSSTYITFPTLEKVSLVMFNYPNLTTISFPVLETVYNLGFLTFTVNNCPNLVTINIPVLANIIGDSGFYDFNNNALSQTTVDNILVKFAATTNMNGTLNLADGTNAAPSATGLAAKATLEGRGWTVTVNS